MDLGFYWYGSGEAEQLSDNLKFLPKPPLSRDSRRWSQNAIKLLQLHIRCMWTSSKTPWVQEAKCAVLSAYSQLVPGPAGSV